jgi:hypothetical protein
MVTLRKGIRQKGFSVRATNHISKAVYSLQRLSTMQSGQSSLICVLDGKLILSKSLYNN